MRILSLGLNLNSPEYLDIFNELEKFNDIQLTPVFLNKEIQSKDDVTHIYKKKTFLSTFSKEADITFEKNQLNRILYDREPEIIELHCEPHYRFCRDVIACSQELDLNCSFILYPEKSLNSFLLPPYNRRRRESLKKISFIVLRDDQLKKNIKETGFQNSYRKISFPAFYIEKKKDKEFFEILLLCDDTAFDQFKERLLSLSDYIKRIRFNIIGNKKAFGHLKEEGFNTKYFDFLSRNETISLLSGIDLSIIWTNKKSFDHTLIPFSFLNRIPCIFSQKTSHILSDPLLIEDIDEYRFKKIILYPESSTKEYTEKAFEKAEKEYSAGKCAFETYELYKYLFRIRKKISL